MTSLQILQVIKETAVVSSEFTDLIFFPGLARDDDLEEGEKIEEAWSPPVNEVVIAPPINSHFPIASPDTIEAPASPDKSVGRSATPNTVTSPKDVASSRDSLVEQEETQNLEKKSADSREIFRDTSGNQVLQLPPSEAEQKQSTTDDVSMRRNVDEDSFRDRNVQWEERRRGEGKEGV